MGHPEPLVQAGGIRGRNQVAEPVADERPGLPVGAPDQRDARRLHKETGDSNQPQREQNEGVLGLGLGAKPPRPLHVAAQRGPQQPGDEHQPEQIQHERVALIDRAFEELEVGGQQVVDLQGDGPQEEDDEPDVDGPMHEACGPVPHERAHGEALAQRVDALLGESAATLPGSPFPVLGPFRKQIEHQTGEAGYTDVEQGNEAGGDVSKDLAADLGVGLVRQGGEPP